MRVISFKICPFVQRVTALLEAKNIAYDLDFISLKDKPSWFLEISPTGQVPVLVTDSGIPLFESDAIVEYLDDVYEPLQAGLTPEQRALQRAWSYQAAKNYLVQCSAMRSGDHETLAERSENLGKAFAKAENVLGDGPFFDGRELSNVDIAWLPLLHRAAIIKTHTGYDFLAAYPKVQAWQAAIMETGLPARSVSTDFEGAFTRFYLSEKTYLGAEECCAGGIGCSCGG